MDDEAGLEIKNIQLVKDLLSPLERKHQIGLRSSELLCSQRAVTKTHIKTENNSWMKKKKKKKLEVFGW